jgi:uncharacterized protein
MLGYVKLSDVSVPSGTKKMLAPQIKVVEKIGGRVLLYSPLSATLSILSQESYLKMKDWQKQPKDFIDQLVSAKLLVSETFSPKAAIVSPETKHATLFVATRCNMDCLYCYAGSKPSGKPLNMEAVRRLVDELAVEQKKTGEKMNLVFHGAGEPSLDLTPVKDIMDYARKKLDSPSFYMQTNGTFTGKGSDWILENLDGIIFSCDGPPEIQNAQRPLLGGKNSSQVVETSVRKAVHRGKAVSMTATLTSLSVKRQKEILEYAYVLGMRTLAMNPLLPSKRSRERGVSVDMNSFLKGFLKARELADDWGMTAVSEIFPSFNPKECMCSFNNPAVFLTAEGKLSSCIQEIGGGEDFEQFSYGSFDGQGFSYDREKIKTITRRTPEEIPACGDCFLKWVCAGGCPRRQYKETGSLFRVSEKLCEAKRMAVLSYLKRLSEKRLLETYPRLEYHNGGLTLNLGFNRFKLRISKNNDDLNGKGSRYVKIDARKIDLTSLLKQILDYRERNQYVPVYFLLDISPKALKNQAKQLITFLEGLKVNRVHFKLVRPAPRCLLEPSESKHLHALEAPATCLDCLRMFAVQNGVAHFCPAAGGSMKLPVDATRMEIYGNFRQRVDAGQCDKCLYGRRKVCYMPCLGAD